RGPGLKSSKRLVLIRMIASRGAGKRYGGDPDSVRHNACLSRRRVRFIHELALRSVRKEKLQCCHNASSMLPVRDILIAAGGGNYMSRVVLALGLCAVVLSVGGCASSAPPELEARRLAPARPQVVTCTMTVEPDNVCRLPKNCREIGTCAEAHY